MILGPDGHSAIVRGRMAHRLEDILSPEDNVIFRCVDCGLSYLPREATVARRRARDKNAAWTWEVFIVCPDPECQSPYFEEYSRAAWHALREREAKKPKIIVPDELRDVN